MVSHQLLFACGFGSFEQYFPYRSESKSVALFELLMVPGTLIMDLFVGNSIFQMSLGEHKCSAEYWSTTGVPVLLWMPHSIEKHGKIWRNI